MPEKTKHNECKRENQVEKPIAVKLETDDENVWSKDQKEKSYYYDDSYGYKIYNPEDDADDDEDE